MFEQEVVLFRYMHGYLQRLTADFTDADLLVTPQGAVNPPAYVLGHLAISNDYTLQLLSRPTVCPEEWMTDFGPGRHPDQLAGRFPSKADLLQVIREGHERVCAAAPQADPEAMAKPQQFSFFENTPIQTIGDCVALLMTTHFSLHIGQLSLMRRLLGHPPLF
jgi:hypothetical protein